MTAVADEIRGWLSETEADELQRLSDGARVLEIGCFVGLSTVAMAQTAAHVVVVDDFRGVPPTDRPDNFGNHAVGDTPQGLRDEFFENLRVADVSDKVTTIVASWENALPNMDFTNIDVVFHDADHCYENTYEAGKLLFDKAPDTTTICFHDYSKSDVGVIRAVDILARETRRKFRLVGSLAVFDGVSKRDAEKRKYRIMLAYPGADFVFG